MRGRRYPRNRSSSPSTVLKTNITRMRPYQPQAPSRNALPASDSRSVAKSRSSGAAHDRDQLLRRGEREDQRDHDQPHATADAAAARAPRRAEPERLADRRPAERPLLATDEDRDEDELPDEADREARRSAPSPSARSPSPAKRSASAGATSQASAAIGSAAAAQTAKIPRIRSCGISTLETAASARAVAVSGYETLICDPPLSVDSMPRR